MKKTWQCGLAVLALGILSLAGCASHQAAENHQAELATSSDQTTAQKRAQIRLELAVGYYQQHELKVALDEIKRALQVDPDFADAYSMRGLIYMEMGEVRLADENFQRAIKLSPNNPDYSNNYGWFLCQNEREKQSLIYFETAAKNRTYRSPAKALNNAGVCSLKVKDTAAAEQYFLQAFQIDPGNPETNANLAKIFYDRHDSQRARFYIDRVIKAEGLTANVLWLSIKVVHKLGDRVAETRLVQQLRQNYANSSEYASFMRGGFDE